MLHIAYCNTAGKHGRGRKTIGVAFVDLESIRPHTQRGDMEMLMGTKCAGRVHWANSGHVPGMQNSSTPCREQQEVGLHKAMLYLKPIPVPTPDGCVDRGCEKGRTWINVCR